MGQLRFERDITTYLPPGHASDFKAYKNYKILFYTTYNDIYKSEHTFSNNIVPTL